MCCKDYSTLKWSLEHDPMTWIVSPGGESIVSASFDSAELLEGVYTGSLSIFSNDPDEMMIELPVSMEVGSGCGDSDQFDSIWRW